MDLSEEQLSVAREPIDAQDFSEYENYADDDLPSSIRDVIRPAKRYYAIVGPDLTDLSSFKTVDI